MIINDNTGRHLVLAADGACLGNPGRGGWAVVTNDYDRDTIVSRFAFAGRADGTTTNNRMELTAANKALQFAKLSTASTITIVSDSQYVIKGATEYLPSWKARGGAKATTRRSSTWTCGRPSMNSSRASMSAGSGPGATTAIP